jgi:hypothetical protein
MIKKKNTLFIDILMIIGSCGTRSLVRNNRSYFFQHNNKFRIDFDSYTYVKTYKQQLLKNITKLLNDLDIKFVISHGNLIEHTRGKYIFGDDDLDIRFDIKDFKKWEDYCNTNLHNNIKYNLDFDNRFYDKKKQIYNGIQAKLIKFDNHQKLKVFPHFDIHLDLVNNNTETDFWPNYDIDFNNLREIEYLTIKTFAPNLDDTNRILRHQYGPGYMKPNINYKLQNNY